MNFSEIFDEYLTDHNISSYKMAAETGISSSLIGYWRRGQRKPTLDNIIAISNYLELPTDYLLKGSLQKEDSPCELTKAEKELLSLVHPLCYDDQQRVIGVVQNYITASTKQRIELPENLPSLSDGLRELKAEQLAKAFKNSTKPAK